MATGQVTHTRHAARGRRAPLLAAVAIALLSVAGCTSGDRSDALEPAPTTSAPQVETASTTSPAATTVAPPPATDPAFVPTGPIANLHRVGPGPDHEMFGVDRDAGISVRLRDGSTLWMFGDTAEIDPSGALTYFVIGTAAWAPPGSPTVTRDFALNGEPVAFATPVTGFPACPGNAPVPGMWPSSAVVQPMGALDRVVVWLENICLGSSVDGAGRGMAVAEWYYDPTAPPDGKPIQATILNQTLFPQRSYGLASTVDDDGDVLAYGCDAPEQGGQPEMYGPCRVAKVSLDSVADPFAYRPWNGVTWAADPLAAVPMELAPGNVPAPYPAGSFSVLKDLAVGAYVMVYSPWPGYSDLLQVRTSTAPTGPWSEPVTIDLPGCSDAVGTQTFWCYAGTAQPIFSSPGQLGVGYYDRHVDSNPNRGSYMVATIPFSPSR